MGGGMRLRNKKTGEIKPAEAREDGIYLYDEITEQWYKYELDLLAKWWEYYEEPKDKGYWYIDDLCRMRYSSELLDEIDDRPNNWMIRKLCGNYFDSREEAEKAVEKLKAWKRLKDKGISLHLQKQFRGDGIGYSRTIYTDFTKDSQEIVKDLDLLFGGEE